MRASWIAVTLAVQVVTVAVLFSFSGHDTQAFPMEAGYVLKNQNLDLVYYEGVPAQLTFEKLDALEKLSHNRTEGPVYYKRSKNLRCERRERNHLSTYRCAIDVRHL